MERISIMAVKLQPWQKGGSKCRGMACEATRNVVYPKTITIEMLDVVNPSGKNKQNLKALPYLNKYANLFNMKDKREIAYFLSQISAESHLMSKPESDNYPVDRMRKYFGYRQVKVRSGKSFKWKRVRRDKLWTQPEKYVYHPKNLA